MAPMMGFLPPKKDNQLANFITTSSKDPKKRFSLRLSAILLNGTVKIYKEKVLLLQGQVVSALQIIHIPSGSKVRLTSVHAEGLFETPPTPVVKIKTKRGKKQIVETPTAVASISEIGFREEELQLPEIEGFIPQATSDLISLREEAPRRSEEHALEEEGFGVLTGKELEMEIDSLFSANTGSTEQDSAQKKV
nr:uncharacterized protein LOC111501855 [Leptinotarsa decemlineata]